MSVSDSHFPVVAPREAARSSSADASIRRMAQMAELDQKSHVLELGCGSGHNSILIAREFESSVIAVDDDEASLERLREAVKRFELTERVQVQKADPEHPPFSEEQFDAIVLYPKLLFPFAPGAKALRKYLKRDGRLFMGYPVRVGRRPVPPALKFWEQKLGEPLLLPGELLQLLASAGFEPEIISTADSAPLDPFYEAAEADSERQGNQPDEILQALREEIARHRANSGATVSFAQVAARRKEPDEKPALRRRG